jgi:alpha-L-fucosidase
MDTNLLLNIGPMANGELPGAALERLEGIGKWMRANSESVKGCGPGPVDGQDWGVSTAPSEGDGRTFYLHVFKAPEGTLDIQVPVKSRVKEVTALDGGAPLPFTKARKAATLSIVLPEIPAGTDYVVKVTLR